MRFRLREDVDYDLAKKTHEAMREYVGSFSSIQDYVLVAGIPVDDMINWCKSANYDEDIPTFEALKKTLSQSREAPQEAA
jgi:hypothetical protein